MSIWWNENAIIPCTLSIAIIIKLFPQLLNRADWVYAPGVKCSARSRKYTLNKNADLDHTKKTHILTVYLIFWIHEKIYHKQKLTKATFYIYLYKSYLRRIFPLEVVMPIYFDSKYDIPSALRWEILSSASLKIAKESNRHKQNNGMASTHVHVGHFSQWLEASICL